MGRRSYKRRLTALFMPLLLLGGCGGGSGGGGSTEGLPRPSSAGAKAVAAAGCTSCHRIGSAGGGGPGPELTRIGLRLPPAAIERVLVSPPSGMPSFKDNDDRATIAAYLESLR
jgi:mono/diheme cytochrome c family protein